MKTFTVHRATPSGPQSVEVSGETYLSNIDGRLTIYATANDPVACFAAGHWSHVIITPAEEPTS
jgi:hypothetical protein